MRRLLVLGVVLSLALTGCDIEMLQESDYPVASPSASPGEFSTGGATAEPEPDGSDQVIEPETTEGSWRFDSGTATVSGSTEKIQELGDFTITIADGTVSGGSTCGRFVSDREDGAYYPTSPIWEPNTIGEDSLCNPAPHSVIVNFGALSPIRLDGDELTLADDTTEMIFTRVDTPDPVVDNWLLISAKDKKGRFSLEVKGQSPDLRLDPQNFFVAQSPCSTASGQWDGGIGDFDLKSIGNTLSGCETTAAQKLENRYLAALRAISTAKIVGGSLVLTGTNVRLVFAAAAAGR